MAEFEAKFCCVCDRCGKTEMLKKIDEEYVDDSSGGSWKAVYEDSMDEWRYIWGRFLCKDCAVAFEECIHRFMNPTENIVEEERTNDE